ncbi:AcrR family transcriptional regulator [Curtobacterium sp. PvP017]
MDAMNTKTEKGYAAGRARREQIVAEATLQFGRVGFNGATILEIAAACGISQAGLLHHFATKESLLEAVLEERDRADRASFRRSGSAQSGGVGVLRGMVDLAARNAELPGIIALYAVLSAEATDPAHPAHEYFVKRYARIRSGTETALDKAKVAGDLIDSVDVAAAAIELTALMDGLQVMWLLDPDGIDMAAQVRRAVQRLLVFPL